MARAAYLELLNAMPILALSLARQDTKIAK